MTKYDLLIIGSGPGGYVAAIRASQLGFKVAVIEKAELGGVCLNWGCIPTKSLLKSAQVFNYIKEAESYGVNISGDVSADFNAIIKRSREVASGMSKGIEYLFKKNKIEVIKGSAKLTKNKSIEVTNKEGKTEYSAKNIILATGARSKQLKAVPIDGEKIIGYRKALTLEKPPESMVIVGSGAIGSEFAYFYNSIGTKVTLVEYMKDIVPLEDQEVSKQLGRSFKKAGIKVMTGSEVTSADTSGKKVKVTIKNKKGKEEVVESDIVLSAVGVTPNIEELALQEAGVETENGKIKVDPFYKTSADGIYAIGDIVAGQALAHVASAEAITCVEKMAGKDVKPINYSNIPACTYASPEVASVGLTEEAAKEGGYELKIGKFPFTASGKASSSGKREGFVKLIFDAKYGELLGAHMIGDNVTEMIGEVVTARTLETTANEIIKSVHPHPTMSEAIMEAAAAAYDEVIHI
ncbi:dihydrolipoyl dehydrogenase [Marinilabiliaceae bacterium ANBcel2]|nr:dihydrolipoyl dehydrogenase [Marinilabiliaceae bacterium ANBcel2]